MNAPVPRGQLPPVPADATVTPWRALLPEGADALSPRMAMVLLLHVSWLRWHGYATMLEHQVTEQDEVDTIVNGPAAGASGLVGHKFGINPQSGERYATGEEIRALALLEGEERDRCAQLAKQAHDMGIFGEEW